MAFTYHIALTGTAYTEFVPSNYPIVTWNKYGDEVFLRPAIDEIKIGALRNPVLYNLLRVMFFDSSTFNNEIKIAIRKNGSDVYNFRSSISNTKIDTNRKLIIITPDPDDAYQDVLNIYDISWVELTSDEAVTPVKHTERPTNAFVNNDFSTFSDVTYTITYTNTTNFPRYADLALGFAINSGYGVVIGINSLSYTGTAPTMRLVDNVGATISNEESITGNSRYYLLSTSGSGGNASIRFQQVDAIGGSSGTLEYTIYVHSGDVNASDLSTLIENLLPATLNFRSTFLRGDALPPEADSNVYAGYPTTRYGSLQLTTVGRMTGVEGVHRFTLKDIITFLKGKLRVFWYIDTEGYFRIEHEKYFRDWTAQLDLTAVEYAKYKPEVDTKLIQYDKSNIFGIIQYGDQNASTEDFVGYPVEYDVTAASNKSKEFYIGITCDLNNIQENGGSDGLVLLHTYNNVCDIADSILSPGTWLLNGALSWAYVQTYYWKYFGEAGVADINNGTTLTIEHVKEFLYQAGVRFYYANLLNWYQPVILELGTAWITKIEHDLSSGFYSLEVGFDPYAIESSITTDLTSITVDSTLITADAI